MQSSGNRLLCMPSLDLSFRTITLLVFVIIATLHNVNMYQNQDLWFIISSVNLIFHEAGHMLMMFFGQFLHIFGGTLFEIGIPLLVAWHFYHRLDWPGTAFATWWLSTACMSVSIYASDAQARILTLLGGDSVGHDWYNLLSILGILNHDQIVGQLFLSLSVVASIVFLYSIWCALQNKNPHIIV